MTPNPGHRNVWYGIEPGTEIFCAECGSWSAICTVNRCNRPVP